MSKPLATNVSTPLWKMTRVKILLMYSIKMLKFNKKKITGIITNTVPVSANKLYYCLFSLNT